MAEGKLSPLIAAVSVLLVGAVLWDAFGSSLARSPKPRLKPSDTTGPVTAHTPAHSHLDTAAAPAPPVAPVASGMPSQMGYMDQLARAESRRRIRASAGYTYLDEVIAQSQDSGLHRWDDRFSRPVRVYLPGGNAANFQPNFLDAVRAAFQRWQDAGLPVRFDVGADSALADVRVRWRVQFEIDRTGQTDLAWDQNGHILSGVVTLATFDPKGRALSEDDIRVVALHEIGHLIGLDHSSDSSDIMFARTQVRDLSPRDIRTALMLYQLAPGSVR